MGFVDYNKNVESVFNHLKLESRNIEDNNDGCICETEGVDVTWIILLLGCFTVCHKYA